MGVTFRVLGPVDATMGSDDLIRTAPGGYLINADDDSLDLPRFRTLAASRRLGIPIAEAFSLNGLGASYSRLNQHGGAISCFTGALKFWRDLGDPFEDRPVPAGNRLRREHN